MRIVARIEKVAPGQYMLNEKIYNNFIDARRELTLFVRRKGAEHEKASVALASRIISSGGIGG